MNFFKAKVIAGKGRGRKLGFPTANLDKTNLNIDCGVYSAKIKSNGKWYRALFHFGQRKTFNEGISLELYIKDFNFDIYHQEIEVKIVKKIREVRKFKGAEELKKQIKKDFKLI